MVQAPPVGRIYGVSHHNAELFALRRLLSVVTGATSFVDMATYAGVVHEGFQAACRARGMMVDDCDLIEAMNEIIATTVPVAAIRRSMARLLAHSAPSDPQALYHMFAQDLCDVNDDASQAANIALLAVENMMQEMGRSLADVEFGFALPDVHDVEPDRRRRRVETGVSAVEAALQRDSLLPQFTHEQHAALHQIVESIASDQQCKVFALLASAGCGKTLFAEGLAAYIRSQNGRVMSVAASALAAMLLTAGTTAHAALHIPIPCNETSTCNLSREDRSNIRRTDLIIWDECSMVHAEIADTVDRTLRDIMNNNHPFGGKCVLFMGDFKQLLPVVRYGKGCNFTMQKCRWWKQVIKLKFSKNWRAVQNPDYTQWLQDIGMGVIEHVVVPPEQRVESYDAMIDKIYGDNLAHAHNHQILALTLETCATINSMCLNKMPGQATEIPAADSYVDCSDRDAFPANYVESLPMKGAPPFMICFKTGARYMCMKNIDIRRGLINGTMLQLLSCGRRYAQFKVLSGKSAGSVELLTKAMFTITPEASGLPFTILRRQYVLPTLHLFCNV